MAERPARSGHLLVAQVTISRYLDPDGEDIVDVDATAVDGSDLDLITTLGMLQMAQLTYSTDCKGDDDGR